MHLIKGSKNAHNSTANSLNKILAENSTPTALVDMQAQNREQEV